MQQKQERLKEELALRVAEVQEENRKKLAATILIELELQDDLSELNDGLNETLSQLSKDSHEQQSARVNDWVNNSPTLISATNQSAPEASVVESNQEQTVGTQSASQSVVAISRRYAISRRKRYWFSAYNCYGAK